MAVPKETPEQGASAPATVQPVFEFAAPQIEPPTSAPTPAPAGSRVAAELEAEVVKLQRASWAKDKDLNKLKEENQRKDEQFRKALEAAGILQGDSPLDAKTIIDKHEKESRSKERREAAIERAALRKLVPTGLGEFEANLVLGSVLRDARVDFDEATGKVSGLDEAFADMKPTIERLTGKPTVTPPATAPPAPPAPSNAAAPMEPEFQGIKTWNDLMAKTITLQERFERDHPAEFKRLEAEWNQNTKRGKPVVTQPSGQLQRM